MKNNPELRQQLITALTCDAGCGHDMDADVCFEHQVDRVAVLLAEARIDELKRLSEYLLSIKLTSRADVERLVRYGNSRLAALNAEERE